ncbi:uncharacterized protein LOC124137078 [Haliotis rufescens]|uniref:uncharacterized protein LOC124137078 n=1 Tax=Haliotis rufescens TaxID=6454 RepID=UPI001EAFB6F9|nr:uncharacterized protein LOC124137078 [Haliotis rufescens]
MRCLSYFSYFRCVSHHLRQVSSTPNMSATNAVRVFARGLTTSAARCRGTTPGSSQYQKVQEFQNMMCRDDGLLVWQKRGFRDTFGYQVTMGMTLIGLIPTGYLLFYKMSFPTKKD